MTIDGTPTSTFLRNGSVFVVGEKKPGAQEATLNAGKMKMLKEYLERRERNIREKLVIIINGSAESGKDTLCTLAGKHYRCQNHSSIDPIKEMAKVGGWIGVKDTKSRRLLSDLKNLMIAYNDWPTKYLIRKYYEFERSDDDILFLHIREPDEIRKFMDAIKPSDDVLLRDFAMLVRRSAAPKMLGNAADDGVAGYPYDAIFVNDTDLDVAEEKFVHMVETAIRFYGLKIAPIVS